MRLLNVVIGDNKCCDKTQYTYIFHIQYIHSYFFSRQNKIAHFLVLVSKSPISVTQYVVLQNYAREKKIQVEETKFEFKILYKGKRNKYRLLKAKFF